MLTKSSSNGTSAPMSEDTVDGYPHQIWWNADGETVVES
jgi:hypothetical protein